MSDPPVSIGIVTALSTEYAAARELLVEPHRVLMPDDPNHYYRATLPSVDPVRSHGVAITVLPHDGNKSASAVCTDLIRSFPTIQCVIMCGIAGGIPMPHDPTRHVRLGDIVVSERGVVDYDHVSTTDGVDRVRRHVQGLSAHLLRGVRELQAEEVQSRWPWEQWLPAPTSPFARPPDSTDVLYRRGEAIAHPARERTGHRPGYPKVHYAAIASADRLLRDERRRDELAAGYQVSAVEMEGSGIAISADLHGRHWLVVRGVVDYCENTGKNDRWHAYGSIAAAAYVRALLAHVPPLAKVPAQREPVGDADLIDALLRIEPLTRPSNRDTLVATLPATVREGIERRSVARQDIVEIVRKCQRAPDGVRELADALRLVFGVGEPGVVEAIEALMASHER